MNEKLSGKSLRHIFSSSSAIFISRVFGLLRDALTTHFFTSGTLDIFTAAFRIPNTFRSIFAEGALNNSFVPIYSEIKGTKEGNDFLNAFFTIFTISVFIITLILVFLTPFLAPLLVKGFGEYSTEKVELTVLLTQFFFSYLFLISIITFFSSICATMFRFFAVNINQAYFNLAFILVIIIARLTGRLSIYTFIYSVIIGGIIQLVAIVYQVFKLKIFLKVKIDLKNPYIKKVLALFFPSLLSSSAYQINIFLSTFFLSYFVGANTYTYIAQRLYLLPVGLFSVALGQVFLSHFSDTGNEKDKKAKLADSLKISLIISLPIIGYFIAMGNPILKFLFFHGQYTLQDISYSTGIFLCYLPGLVFVSINRTFISYYYAKKETRIPVILSVSSVVVFALLVILLKPSTGIYSIALANTLSVLFQTVFFLILGRHHIPYKTIKYFYYVKYFLISLIATVIVYLLSRFYKWVDPLVFNLTALKHIVFIGTLSILYFSIFSLLAWIFNIREIKSLINLVLNKLKVIK